MVSSVFIVPHSGCFVDFTYKQMFLKSRDEVNYDLNDKHQVRRFLASPECAC